MVNAFELLSSDMKSYMLFQLLKHSTTDTLQFVNSMIVPALKRDFLKHLPLELSLHVLSYLDATALCRAACVSRTWRAIVDLDSKTWRSLLQRDGFHFDDSWEHTKPQDQSIKLESSGESPHPAIKSEPMDWSDDEPRRKRSWDESDRSCKMEVDEPFNDPSALYRLKKHPYKDIYRRQYTLRQNWLLGRAKRTTFEGHREHVVTCLQFDDDKIISGADDNLINIYDTNTGERRHSLQGHEGGVWALQYIDNTLVSGSTDRTVRVWDIKLGVCTHTFLGHTSTVRCLQIIMPTLINGRMQPSEPLIVTGSRDTTLRVWRLPNPKEDAPFDGNGLNPWFLHTLTGHGHSVRSLAAHGNRLVSGSYDCTVCVWDVEAGRLLHRMEGHVSKVYSVVIDPERNRCMSGSMDTTVRIWDIDTGECLNVLEGHHILVGLLGLTPHRLVSAAADATLRVWHPKTGELQHVLQGHTGAITCFQHDDEKVVSGSEGGLKLWDIKTGRFTRDLISGVGGVWRVAMDKRRCVAATHTDNMTSFEVLDFGVHGLEDDNA
ncbi:WD40-repeat-containing domain protein [Syncephalastrum racemosum]|uniref:WD40-repeat-containing domain protein n=1 Tax=Syncephalastrum racemosum TaxID=13706 RepID=A0A1X2HB10_SYNRA|nr:WD40-repeat-containing domain protein [Syncephalastrum racemosum]